MVPTRGMPWPLEFTVTEHLGSFLRLYTVKLNHIKSEMLKFHFLLGLRLLGAGVEGKEGSVTAEEQMKSTFLPKLMSVRLSPIC